ncbi:hypothetical protein AB3X94_37150 [Paraburkholderia sp. BR10923]|uniref:hypothetical protein n=1 Tax=Paraburkholderia sp. BR10923 TaxID=3236992 RepID=UPI0034CD5BB4
MSTKNWIQGAIKKPGALRRTLGVKQGETIPVKKLNKVTAEGSKASATTKRRANLAKTLRSFHK